MSAFREKKKEQSKCFKSPHASIVPTLCASRVVMSAASFDMATFSETAVAAAKYGQDGYIVRL